jgi:hypothetical protein
MLHTQLDACIKMQVLFDNRKYEDFFYTILQSWQLKKQSKKIMAYAPLLVPIAKQLGHPG